MAFEVVIISIIVIMFIILIICTESLAVAYRILLWILPVTMIMTSPAHPQSQFHLDLTKTRAVNAKGLEMLSNSMVSMRSLDLAHQVLQSPEVHER
jgi:hypothetical protein